METIGTEARFTAPQVPEGPFANTPAVHGMEHRWGLRIPCRANVRLSVGDGATAHGRMRNISMSGAYVETPAALPLYAPIAIAVQRDDGSMGKELSGCVVRRDARGVGIEWAENAAGAACRLLNCTEPCVRP